MTTKIDIINDAYSQLRISGLTSQPVPEDLALALGRLENMMAELPININYNFEEVPDANSLTNVERKHWHMMATNLAVRLIADFNKAAPQVLIAQADQSLSQSISKVSSDNIRQIKYPNRHPIGSGNENKYGQLYRFYSNQDDPVNNPATARLVAGDVEDYTEDYTSYLKDLEFIDSFTVTADSGLSVISSSNDDDTVSYRIKAESTANGSYRVVISVTTDTGRVTNRAIMFEVLGA